MPVTMINNQADDEISLITHMYPDVYSQMAQHQDDDGNSTSKPARRRRRRSKTAVEQGGGGAAAAMMVAAGKRKLNEGQVSSLEKSFEDEHKLESERKDRLAKDLGLDPRQVAVWFQNRRARWKNKKLEEEYSSLKKMYDTVLVHKSNLESQVLRMTEQLNEADREIQKLVERVDIRSSNSPASSLSMEAAMEPPFFGDYVAAVWPGYDQNPVAGLHVDDNCYLPNVEWMMGGLYM